MFLLKSVNYTITLLNQLKKMTKKSTKKSLFIKISRRLVKLDLNKILPSIQNMQIYCLSCKKKTGNNWLKRSNNEK